MLSYKFRCSTTKVVLLALTLLPVGCGSDQDPINEGPKVPESGEYVSSLEQRVLDPQVAQADQETQLQGNRDFAFELYQGLKSSGENLLYSPHSISVALAMLYAGARSSTEQQIAAALHFDLDQNLLHPFFNWLDLQLNSRGQGSEAADGGDFKLAVVNALWGQKDFSFLDEYLDRIALNYGAGLRLMDFAGQPDASRQEINEWVAQKTEQRVKDLLPEGSVDGITKLVLTNAVYFNAAWAEKFQESKTTELDFHLAGGTTKKVPTMAGQVEGRHYQGSGFQAAALPYDGHELSMLILLPDQGQLVALEQSLSGGEVATILDQLQHAELDVRLPSFEFEAKMDLVSQLKALGVTDVFSSMASDLSGIDGTRQLYVTGAFHKAFIKVNEKGTEAAAATGIVVAPTAAPPEPTAFYVDRPFLFVIFDEATGAPLFVGRVMDPAA